MRECCLTIRRCPGPVRTALRDRARRHQRSLNSEMIAVLTAAVLPQARLAEPELRRRIEALPFRTGLTDSETRAAIREGRK